MPKVYAGRAPGVVPVNFTIDKDAYELLQQQAPAKKAYGRFISRLIYEHCARQEERQRLRTQMVTVLNRATQHWHTGSTHKRAIALCLGHRVYESRVE